MFKKQRKDLLPPPPIFYRIYVLYFQTSTSVLRSLNREAFYHLSIWHEQDKIAEMLEGLNPVVLANKVFLRNACLNFDHNPKKPQLKMHLWYHYRGEDHVLARAELDLTEINKNFEQKEEKHASKQFITFPVTNGELKLVFNIFLEKDKVELDTFINKFREEEKEMNKMKRIELGRQKMSSVAQPLKKKSSNSPIMVRPPQMSKRQTKQSVIRIDFDEEDQQEDKKQLPIYERAQSVENLDSPQPIKKISKFYTLTDKRSISQQKTSKINHQDSDSSGTYLQINSAAQLHTRAANIKKFRTIINQLEQQKQKQPSVSSHLSSNNKSGADKQFNVLMGTTSVVSDGSQASEMLRNNSSESYSQRAVNKFKNRVFRCANITVIFLAIVMLYFLFMPTARFSKAPKRNQRMKKGTSNWLKF